MLKAGLSHLWFVTVHPFDDGNGRIARGIGDMLLAMKMPAKPQPRMTVPSADAHTNARSTAGRIQSAMSSSGRPLWSAVTAACT